ncbi:ARPP-1 family domain-containing protein [Haliangium sp.]|uniref:ARPP-1 family domain-containing protein n=1 Tax=Haliangium sp. TaxID=2663208 RepID=UPI003D131C93
MKPTLVALAALAAAALPAPAAAQVQVQAPQRQTRQPHPSQAPAPQPQAGQRQAPPPASPAGKNQFTLAPVQYENLTLVPVATTAPAAGQRYLVLDEGMTSGQVRVVETKEGGEVNELVLENRSSEPLFLLAGEVVIGGKQDRIIGKDTIVPPKSSERIPVFCVEHGRWSGRKADFSTAKALAHTKLRRQAKYAGQSDVWQEVASKNAMRQVSNDTDTYRAVATGTTVSRSIADYERHFRGALRTVAGRSDVVGYAVAINGEVVAIETFGSPDLFRKLEDKLLRSYYVEAVDHPLDRDKAKRPPTDADVRSFRAKAERAKRAHGRTVREGKAARTVQFDEPELQGSSVNNPYDAEPVYDAAYKKD